MATSNRSSLECWLLGKPVDSLSCARLPRKRDVLSLYLFHHVVEKKTVMEGLNLACGKVLTVWERARIPTQRVDACVRKLRGIHDKYQALKKHRTRGRESDRVKEKMFLDDLQDLFDVATSDALQTMTNEEDKEFLKMQREDVFSCSIAGIDAKKSGVEARRGKRNEQEAALKRRYDEREAKVQGAAAAFSSSSTSSEESQADDDYRPSTSACTSGSPAKRPKNIFTSPEVVGALDRVNLPDRGAAFVTGAVAQALGHDISDLTFSRSSIRRSRRHTRQIQDEEARKKFHAAGPLLLHWDGKMLQEMGGKTVERVAILVTGQGFEKLLGIPSAARSTGEAQAAACLELLESWKIRDEVVGLVFDTTASNTGLHKGACVRIEEGLGRELAMLACRHHVLEIVLSDVFRVVFGDTGGPEVALFKRFQKEWPTINQQEYTVAEDTLFEGHLEQLRSQMKDYLASALADPTKCPREDYFEFLQLAALFLGGGTTTQPSFRAPGAIHHARWMSKGIYCLKMFLFRHQFKTTKREERNVTVMALFIALVYVRFWHEAPLSSHAPHNDIMMLTELQKYTNQINVAATASNALQRHLWYLAEDLVGFSLLDDRVPDKMKADCVTRMKTENPIEDHPRRAKIKDTRYIRLDAFFTKRSYRVFDVLKKGGAQEAKQGFLQMDPLTWKGDKLYEDFQARAKSLRVVNDAAERGVALAEAYNATLTKDEDQKQFIFRFVHEHRMAIPTPSKTNLMKKK